MGQGGAGAAESDDWHADPRGRNTISLSVALPFPFNFCARGFQHSEQISYSLSSISFGKHSFGLPRKSQISTEHTYSQWDQALPCSSCFFLARASMRRRSEHSSQIVISEGLPHTLQMWCACSGGSDRKGTIFMLCLLSNVVRRRRCV